MNTIGGGNEASIASFVSMGIITITSIVGVIVVIHNSGNILGNKLLSSDAFNNISNINTIDLFETSEHSENGKTFEFETNPKICR